MLQFLLMQNKKKLYCHPNSQVGGEMEDSMVRNLIEGIGISDKLPENPKYFTEMSFPVMDVIPYDRPDIEELISIMADVQLVSVKAVKTPHDAISHEGQHLSGCKLIIELKLRQKIKYTGYESAPSVHAVSFESTLRSIFVVVPCRIDGVPIEDLLRAEKVIVTPYIEDIYARALDKRKIFKNVVILVDVTILSLKAKDAFCDMTYRIRRLQDKD